MSTDQNSKSGLSIEADEKNGHVSGTGTLTVSRDKASVMAAFTAQDNGKTKITLSFSDDIAVAAGADLKFEGHGDLDPFTGKWSAGTSVTYTVDHAAALQLKAQLDATGPSAQLNLSIPL